MLFDFRTGRAVGLVTSLGNTFWYVPAASGNGQPAAFYRTSSTQSTTSTSFIGIQGLPFTGAANSFYAVQIYVSYWQSNFASPVIAFAISVPTGASFLFCGGMFWADPAQATTDFTPGNLCTSVLNSSLGSTHNTQTWCTTSSSACEFVGTAFVYFGSTSGPFQFEFEGSAADTANVAANSVIVVTRAG